MKPARRSLCGLDWLNFFVADVEAGLGPIVAAHLATLHVRQRDIGLVLTLGALAGLMAQTPLGALVDVARRKRLLVAVGILGIGVGALILSVARTVSYTLIAEILHGVVGGIVGPGVAAITLGLVGSQQLGSRLGRSRSFDAAGNILAAGAFALAGYLLSSRLVFVTAALFSIPALASLAAIRPDDVDASRARGGDPSSSDALAVILDRRLWLFAAASVLFHFANAAMLPLLGASLAAADSLHAVSLMSSCVLIAQLVVVVGARQVGRWANSWGRKRLLIVAFAVLPIRGAICAIVRSAPALLATQVLDGIGAVVFGVCSILVVADLTAGTGRFNVTRGALTTAVGVGAALSNGVAGAVADRAGRREAFLVLGGIALVAFLLALALPETRPVRKVPVTLVTERGKLTIAKRSCEGT